MKKVLSVLLAAAMVMGMSVSSFATANANVVIGSANTNTDAVGVDITNINFFETEYYVIRSGKADAIVVDGTTNKVISGATVGSTFTFEPGDDVYFYLENGTSMYYNLIDKDWYINVKANGYVDKVSFTTSEVYTVVESNLSAATPATVPAVNLLSTTTAKMVKLEIADNFDDVDSATAKVYMYIADKATSNQSKSLSGAWSFGNAAELYVSFDFINDADRAAKWVVAKDVKGTAVFNLGDDAAYFTVKMISEEKVVINLSQKFDKTIDNEYNEHDADVDFYNFKGTSDEFTKKGELVIPADEDTFIYEVVDGELVAVEAEYVEDYKVGNYKKVDGWMIETDELGYYVVADEELVVAEEEVEVEAPVVEDNKANPETGANDFVGAAVALAVVSVAAAGALALKK